MFFSSNPEIDYETRLTLRHHRGEQLTPEEERRLAESDKRFKRDFYRGLAIVYAIVLPIFAIIIYRQMRGG